MANPKAKKTVDLNQQTVTFDFATGEKVVCGLGALSQEIITQLALHGLSQKIGDSYASPDVVPYSAASDVWAMLQGGNWKSQQSGGGQLAEALHKVTGKALEDCREVLQGMDDKAKKLLRANPEIAEALAAIKLEAARKAAENADGSGGMDLGALFQ